MSDERGPNEILLGAPADPTEAVAPRPSTVVKVAEPAPDAPPLPAPPPRAGRGSSAEAWRQWAESAGVAVQDDAGRDDIIAACEAAGVLTGTENI